MPAKINVTSHISLHTWSRSNYVSEMSTDQDWIGLDQGLDRPKIFLKIGGAGLDRTEKICCFSNNMKNVGCIVILQIG